VSAQGKAPWFRFFSSDFLSWTRTMKSGDTGVFVTLLAMLHERGEPLPYDAARLARFCNTTKSALENAVSRLRADGLLSINGGYLWSDIIERECEFREEKSQKAKSAANIRHEKSKKNQRRDDADAMQTRGRGIVRGENPSRGFSPNSDFNAGLDENEADGDASDIAPEGASVIFRSGDSCRNLMRTVDPLTPIRFASEEAQGELVDYVVRQASRMGADEETCADLHRIIREMTKRGQLTKAQAEEELRRFTPKAGGKNERQA